MVENTQWGGGAGVAKSSGVETMAGSFGVGWGALPILKARCPAHFLPPTIFLCSKRL